ncbi:MAG: HDOD domain-containing protein [Planctomycetota bacterium]
MTQHVDSILREIKSLEPLPEVAQRVLAISSRADVIPRELIAIIETDVAMTAKVLKLSNSAYYGFRREIASIHEAGNLLGVSALVNLVLTACTGRYFRNYGSSDHSSTRKLWESSVASALAASLLANVLGGVDRNRAYTAGLLQNIGTIVLDRFVHGSQPEIEAALERGASALAAEEQVLGLHHAEVGARLAEKWGFPPVLVDTIRYHHEPERATHDTTLAFIVHLGEQVAFALDGTQESGDVLELLRAGLAPIGGTNEERLASVLAELEHEMEAAREFVAQS